MATNHIISLFVLNFNTSIGKMDWPFTVMELAKKKKKLKRKTIVD